MNTFNAVALQGLLLLENVGVLTLETAAFTTMLFTLINVVIVAMPVVLVLFLVHKVRKDKKADIKSDIK